LQDFTHFYHLDLHGNVRRNPKLSGTTHNVFGIQVGVGITVAVRNSQNTGRQLYYYRVPEFWRKGEKLSFLAKAKSINNIDWVQLQPDEKYTWLSEGIQPEFATFLPIGTKETKSARGINAEAIFKMYSLGVVTSRDSYAYSFDAQKLRNQVRTFIEIYNRTVDKLKRQGNEIDPLSLVDNSDPHIKWTRQVKAALKRLLYSQFFESHIRNCVYRPFTRKKLYFDDFWNEEPYQQGIIFPTLMSENENSAIIVSDHGFRSSFSVLVANVIPELHLLASTDAVQCFPYYIYKEDGFNRYENITDWALTEFQTKYGPDVTKWDIFHYVYAMLHHPQYRERFVENLKHDLPHIPLLHRKETFLVSVRIGQQLMDIHLHYEQAKEYPLKWNENRNVPFSWRVEKMILMLDKTAVKVNESITLAGIPQECFAYRLGNRSALEWVIDQYQVSIDKRSGNVSDPNQLNDEEYIVRLVGKVVTVSVETVNLVKELEQTVTQEDWMSKIEEAHSIL
jgi:predicted helicase